jgi:hypothetical protein
MQQSTVTEGGMFFLDWRTVGLCPLFYVKKKISACGAQYVDPQALHTHSTIHTTQITLVLVDVGGIALMLDGKLLFRCK